MAFPTSQIDTTNLDSASDDPSLARSDLLDTVTSLNSIIADANGANGVVVANASGKIAASKLPNTITSTGTQTFNPTNGIVNIQNILRLSSLTTAQLNALTTNTEGDVAMVSDGDTGDLCLGVYDGTNWKVVALGATISAT